MSAPRIRFEVRTVPRDPHPDGLETVAIHCERHNAPLGTLTMYPDEAAELRRRLDAHEEPDPLSVLIVEKIKRMHKAGRELLRVVTKAVSVPDAGPTSDEWRCAVEELERALDAAEPTKEKK